MADADASPPEDSAGVGDALARARPDETGGLVLARAKVAAELFGQAAPGLGRFRILERLGAGGMGVVHAAYDPDLDRGVALKLVPVPATGRDAALAEAKALARLSHPNVVPIFDVGIAGEHVYLVMELVRGKTLGRWVEGRSRRDVLDAYLQAGAALAAAHESGLVHRDFKPENAIVGPEGRVRVVDFGLACQAEDPERVGAQDPRIAGTPRYMPPEQASGLAVTPAVDQYSFCVALEEGLAACAEQPTPRWVGAVIERGRAAEPSARFDSMNELVRALARDPVTVWRRRGVLAALAVTIGVIAFVVGRQNAGAPGPEVCNGYDAQIEQTWSRAARTAALSRLDTFGDYGRTVRIRAAPQLETFATRWIDASRETCLGHRGGGVSDALYDLQVACLSKSRAAFGAVAKITTESTVETLADLPRGMRELLDPALCTNPSSLISDVERPASQSQAQVSVLGARLSEARTLLGAGRYSEALAASSSVVADARRVGYPPLLAEALLVEGHAALAADPATATPILAAAQQAAISARVDSLAIEAWARRAWAQSRTAPSTALAGVDVIEPLARRTPRAQFARALLYNNIGSIELANEHRDRARDAFRTALDEARGYSGPGETELVNIRANLAIVTDDRPAADKLMLEAIAELTHRLGETHPDTLQLRWIRGTMTIEAMSSARETLTPVCTAYELHAGLGAMAGACWAEVGQLQLERGDRSAAVRSLERARRTIPASVELAGNLQLARGNTAAAAAEFANALAGKRPTPDETWWARLDRAKLQLGLGRARRALGDLAAARRELQASIAALDARVRNHPSTFWELRLGRARVELALTLAALRTDTSERGPVVAAALSWLRRADGDPDEIAALERFE